MIANPQLHPFPQEYWTQPPRHASPCDPPVATQPLQGECKRRRKPISTWRGVEGPLRHRTPDRTFGSSSECCLCQMDTAKVEICILKFRNHAQQGYKTTHGGREASTVRFEFRLWFSALLQFNAVELGPRTRRHRVSRSCCSLHSSPWAARTI